MRSPDRRTASLVAAAALVAAAVAVRAQTPAPRRDAGGFVAPTPALERGRTVYVLNACHFCHGLDLTGATMGAADLMHSPLVGADEDGNAIGAIARAGLPNLQTAMPSFRDLTNEQVIDLARYVHFLRQQGRFRELTQAAGAGTGNAAAGQQYFDANCGTCHSLTGDLAGLARKYDAPALRARLLRPRGAFAAEIDKPSAGVAAHGKLLENVTPAAVDDLVACLRARTT